MFGILADLPVKITIVVVTDFLVHITKLEQIPAFLDHTICLFKAGVEGLRVISGAVIL